MKKVETKALDGRDLLEIYYEDEDRLLLCTFHFFPSDFYLATPRCGFGVLLLSCVMEDTKVSVPFGSLLYSAQQEIWTAAFEHADAALNNP